MTRNWTNFKLEIWHVCQIWKPENTRKRTHTQLDAREKLEWLDSDWIPGRNLAFASCIRVWLADCLQSSSCRIALLVYVYICLSASFLRYRWLPSIPKLRVIRTASTVLERYKWRSAFWRTIQHTFHSRTCLIAPRVLKGGMLRYGTFHLSGLYR